MDEKQLPPPEEEKLLEAPPEEKLIDAPHEPLLEAHNPAPKRSRKFLIFMGIVFTLILAGAAAASVRYFAPTPANDRVVPPTAPTDTPTPVDPTADWKTYRNEEYGFEFKYPGNWISSSDTTRLVSIHPNIPSEDVLPDATGKVIPDSIEVAAHLNIRKLSESEFIQDKYKSTGVMDENSLKYLLVGGKEAAQLSTFEYDRKLHTALSLNDSDILEITWIVSGSEYKIPQNTYFQILSTFKFNETTVTPSPTCIPRPACLDAEPACLLQPQGEWCPKE